MIKQIIKSLNASECITDWIIQKISTHSSQAFYVMEKLETRRLVDTTEYHVTVYKNFSEGEVSFTGSSSFVLSHPLSKNELMKKIEVAAYAAQFVKNKAFKLVEGGKKKSWKQMPFSTEPFALLEQIASCFFSVSELHCRFNALEAFYNTITTNTVSSKGVNYQKTLHKVAVESIPSFDGPLNKVELYKHYNYTSINLDVIKNDAIDALKDVKARYDAKAVENLRKADVIIKDEDLKNLFDNLIENYSYDAVYLHTTDKVIGDFIQKDVTGEFLTISLIPSSKADAFDSDGVLLSPVKVVDKGILVNYYGSNKYAYYLGLKPSGMMNTIKVEKGKSTYAQMTKKPHLEIIALSGIQIDMYSGYIGGEVRLANYFDGFVNHPVSGFSFSGNIEKSLSTLALSKETTIIQGYQGPKYLKIKNMEII